MPLVASISQLTIASPPAPVLGTPGVVIVVGVVVEVVDVCAEATAPVVINIIAANAIRMCFLIVIYLLVVT